MYAISDIYDKTITNGGGTFYDDGRSYHGGGYAVALVTGSYAIVDRDNIVAFGDNINQMLYDDSIPHPFFIGTWTHDGKIYIDPSIVVPDLNAALVIARAFNQLSIYDLNNDVEIEVK